MEAIFYYAIAVLILLLMAAPAAIAFLHGMVTRRIGKFPLRWMLFFSFGIMIFDHFFDMAIGRAGDQSFADRMIWSAGYAAAGTLFWGLGFIVGRSRDGRRGVIRNRIG